MAYDGQFWFGTPSQKMNIIFDTGSSVAWLFSEQCGKNCPEGIEKFNQKKSESFHQMEKGNQLLGYAKGEIAGHPAKDKICFSSE